MANKEIADYLTTVTPDYDAFLSVIAPASVAEIVDKNQVKHDFDDGSDRVITLSATPIAQITLQFPEGITEEDAGTIMDFFLDVNKANGYARSFKYFYPKDGHNYVVKFKSRISRKRTFLNHLGLVPVDEVVLKIVGNVSA